MIKVILFDCDGPIIKREKYFSQRMRELSKIQIDTAKEKEFFEGVFLKCEIGKADLKEVLPSFLSVWKWDKNADEFLAFWFEGERKVDLEMIDYIQSLRQKGILCYLSTNNEKYRTEYLWNEVGLKQSLDGLFSSCYVGHLKAQINFWEEVYKNFSTIQKNQVLVLDDKQSAINSALQFGFKAEFFKSLPDFKLDMEKYL